MNIRPVQDRIAVKKLEEDSTSAGGIIIPDTAKQKPMKGRVLAVGRGMRYPNGAFQETEVKVGDVVVFVHYAGHTANLGGEEVTFICEKDCLAVVQE
jgi:chaperonin GroES